MPQYNFDTLNSSDLELLVRDLLNAEEKARGSKIIFRSFPEGKDRGIDLLDNNSGPGNYNIIVQVKHQPDITFNALLKALSHSTKTRQSEIEKIKKLSPHRYIVATSRSLTLANREEIMNAMAPYILSVNDIIDKVELNRLLSVHDKIEQDHQKLWFSSVAVFEKILHNDVYGRSGQLAEDIRQKVRLYVPVNNINAAIALLQVTKFIVIVGEPGCGKTTYAEMILHKLAGMDFKCYWIDKSVSEVDSQLKDDNSKQVFYFDDFLGHTRYEIEMAKTQEKGLLHFLKQILRLENKYFILTTRISLINAAANDSEKFRNSGIFRQKQEINVYGLTVNDKVSIIKNHLEVKEVAEDYRKQLIGRLLLKMAKHPNFSPRIIEFITTYDNYKEIEPADYPGYIFKHLTNPHEIWLHAYEQQLDEFDRFLLNSLYSFGSGVTQSHLEKAYEERLNYEVTVNNIPRPGNSFRRSVKKLLGSFISFKRYYEGEKLEFINPSLEDFLNRYLADDFSEQLRMIGGSYYIDQRLFYYFMSRNMPGASAPGGYFRKRVEQENTDTTYNMEESAKTAYLNLYSAITCLMYFRDERAITVTTSFLRNVNWLSLERVNYYHLMSFLQRVEKYPEMKQYIQENFEQVFMAAMNTIQEVERMEDVKLLFDLYGNNYGNYISNQVNRVEVKARIDFFFEDRVFDVIESMYNQVTSPGEVEYARKDIETDILAQYRIMEIDSPAHLHGFDAVKWESVCATNQFTREMLRDNEETAAILPDD